MKTKDKIEKRQRRHCRLRARIKGTAKIPRLSVFKSNIHIYAQLLDDEKQKTLLAISDIDQEFKAGSKKGVIKHRVKEEENKKQYSGKAKTAFELGKTIAEKALENKIEKVVFDRGGYAYHGRIKALAEGAREGGLKL